VTKKQETTQELFDFMMEKCGGKDVVLVEFAKSKLAKLNASMTLGQLLETADEQDLGDWFRGLAIKEFATIVGLKEKKARTSRRLTKEDKAELQKQILDFIKKREWSGTADIAQEIGRDVKVVGRQLKELVAEKKAKKKGEKVNTKYAVI
jgi:hypothetical protein